MAFEKESASRYSKQAILSVIFGSITIVLLAVLIKVMAWKLIFGAWPLLLLTAILAIAAIKIGFDAVKKTTDNPLLKGRKIAILGIILGALYVLGIVVVLFVFPPLLLLFMIIFGEPGFF